MRIAVIGGGIGGLSAALQLLKAGFDVYVYEQAAAIGEIGAGIQISPNASRLLVRVTLLGDACHPMLPMMAQGAAQSIEDGAALAASLTTRPGDVTGALVRYEEVRKPRATRLQEVSAANRKRFHLPDGPEQQKRDEALATSGDRSITNIGWLYRHDAAQMA
jgi:2-polyprenyl-6-methoxyphenol hydroxylase-like FAD-dependent oxidoreductase